MPNVAADPVPAISKTDDRRPQLHSLNFRALGSEITVWLAHSHAPTARFALNRARIQIEVAEARLSRFRPDSELSRLNENRERNIRVSPLLYRCLENALAGADRSGGLYDPAILGALEAAGYTSTFSDLHRTEGGAASAQSWSSGGWRRIRLDSRERIVRLPKGVRIDLGGVGKAWIAELIADDLGGVGPCLVDAGGDIAMRGIPPHDDGWTIGIADPLSPDDDLTQITVRERGVATSGIEYRRWQQGGIIRHHIIDPRSGEPAITDLLSVTVIARRAEEANLHALVALIHGAIDGQRYLDAQPEVDGLLVRADGSVLRTREFGKLESVGACA
ncbi:MAG TPA: FAD:protein FMN transferase [Chloroflexota bacterium]|nr:FAD:protein FMN transferase [Chloroflexota bacterium]